MNAKLQSLLIISSSIGLMLTSCSKTDVKQPNNSFEETNLTAGKSSDNSNTTYYGAVVQMGNGQIRSFGILEKQTNKPLSLGFELTANSLSGLPGDDHAEGEGHSEAHYSIKFHPTVAAATNFTHLVADWNPHGHEPGPYLLSHFDFHFYMISEATRLGITANDPKSVSPLPSGYLPDYYIGPLGPEPQMGGHCVDVTSPELNGSIFTHTFIYGAYDSKVAFYEPMVTHDYLMNGVGGSFNIKQPTKFSKAGYYPTKYNVTKDVSGTRYITLTDFVFKNAN